MSFKMNCKRHGLFTNDISKRTGISVERLREIDLRGTSTKHEAELIASLAQIEICQLFANI